METEAAHYDAAYGGYTATLEWLAQHGADLKAQDEDGNIYYVNSETGETGWTREDVGGSSADYAAYTEEEEEELPEGVEKHVDPSSGSGASLLVSRVVPPLSRRRENLSRLLTVERVERGAWCEMCAPPPLVRPRALRRVCRPRRA